MERDLKQRTKTFALRIIKLYSALPRRGEAKVLGNQILKSGTSVGANYREACRAKSNADFISKVEGALQEGRNGLLAGINRRGCDSAYEPLERITRRSRGTDCDFRNDRDKSEAQELQATAVTEFLSSFILHPS